jgi:hypothetical protein
MALTGNARASLYVPLITAIFTKAAARPLKVAGRAEINVAVTPDEGSHNGFCFAGPCVRMPP